MTQQNAALVEQAAAAAESMQDQAQRLAEAVAIFKLGGEQVALAAPVRPAASLAGKSATVTARKPPARAVAMVSAPVKNTPAKKAAPAPAGDDWEEF
jgi:hypothetical protein